MCRVECPLVPPVAGTIPQLKDKIEEIFAHVDAAERKQASPRPDRVRACGQMGGACARSEIELAHAVGRVLEYHRAL